MLSEDLSLTIHAFDKTLLSSIEAECPRHVRASAQVFRANLDDILARLKEMERAAAPRLTGPDDANVVQLPRRPRLVPHPSTPDGGDAA